MSFFAPTKFVWRLGGNQVHLCGSFTRWVETVPMIPEEGQPGVFSVVVHLPPGYHQYKFIVDGEWRHDEAQPFMPDPLGNVNNWLFVRKPENRSLGQIHGQSPVTSSPNLGQLGELQSPASQMYSEEIQDRAAADLSQVVPDVNLDTSVPVQQEHQENEPEFTRGKIWEFLSHHKAFELMPESGKVVLLDLDLPVRQAFHALHDEMIASAPLSDNRTGAICGIISASDFIATLQRLRNLVSTSSNPMSEAEMDQHTIRGLREELNREGRSPKPLVSVSPDDTLQHVVKTLYNNHCNMAPILRKKSADQNDLSKERQDVLHNATLGGVLACVVRHFRSSLASLPLLKQPLHVLPIGTWCPESDVVLAEKGLNAGASSISEDGCPRKVAPLITVNPATSLTQAFGLLLEGGFSCLPVVDDHGVLVDIYARADITALAKSNAYSRLQFEDVTVGQALALIAQPAPPAMLAGMQGWGGASPSASQSSIHESPGPGSKQRVHACSTNDPLRSVLERLAIPGVRRLLVVNPNSRKLEGIISLSDVASYLMLP